MKMLGAKAFQKRTRSKDEVQKDKVGKFEVKKVKNKGAVSKNVVRVAICPRSPASDFGSNGPRFESGRARCVESLDKALYSHCPKEKPSH